MTDHTQEAYNAIDVFLNKLKLHGADTIANVGDRNSTSSNIAFNILFDEGLISSRKGFKDRLGVVDITPLGLEVITLGGYSVYLLSKQKIREEEQRALKLQRHKDSVDLELSEKTLKDFPRTRKQAIIAFWLAIALAIFELTKFVLELVNSK